MKHRIDPKIDCVFKALLGAPENRNLLIHFLNAVLQGDLASPITAVDVIDPANEKEHREDKRSVVDVKARDAEGRLYQVEVQIIDYQNLPARITYNWTDIHSQQLQSGQDYLEIKPTYAIWLLANNLIKDDEAYAQRVKLRNEQGRVVLNDCGGIYLFELRKLVADPVETEEQRWLRFFKEGERLDDEALPAWMTTKEMQQAMATLRGFSEKERDYFAYQARQEYLREQRTIWRELELARQEKDAALKEKDAALKEMDVALKGKEEALYTVARRLLGMGLTAEQVADATGLGETTIRALSAASKDGIH